MDLGLDLEAYKDYVNNLKQFAHLNSDFEIFAKDSLKLTDPQYREMVEFKSLDKTESQEELARI